MVEVVTNALNANATTLTVSTNFDFNGAQKSDVYKNRMSVNECMIHPLFQDDNTRYWPVNIDVNAFNALHNVA